MSALLTPPRQPSTNLLTAEEFFERYENRPFELVDGQAVEVAMPGGKHGKACSRSNKYLSNFVDDHNLGHVMSNDTFVVTRRNPDGVRGPDVFFISYAKMPVDEVPAGPIQVAPELVFEVLSPSDSWTDAIAKMLEYLNAGVQAVAIIDPEVESVVVYRQKKRPETFEKGQTLVIPDILPGFEVPVAKFFN